MIRLSQDTKYAYQVGQIRVLEKRLFSYRDIVRLIDTHFEQVIKAMIERGYEAVEDIDTMIIDDRVALINRIVRLLGSDNILKYFVGFKWDILNVRAYFKSKLGEATLDVPYLKGSGFDPGKYDIGEAIKKGMIWRDIIHIIRDNYKDFVKEIFEAKRGSDIDEIVSKFYFSALYNIADYIGSDFMKAIIKSDIDIANIINFYRIKSLDLPFVRFEDMFIAGGRLGIYNFKEAFTRKIEDTSRFFVGTPYDGFISESIKYYKDTGRFSYFDTGRDNIVMDIASVSKTTPFGYEPIITYYIAKEIEYKNLMLVYKCLESGIKADEIRPLIRRGYA